MKGESFIIQHRLSIQNFESLLKPRFSLTNIKKQRHSLSYLDTFDWKLLKANAFLMNAGSQVCFFDYKSDKIIRSEENINKIEFSEDFQNSELKKQLQKTTSPRALTVKFTINKLEKSGNIVNEDEKIICCFSIEEYKLLKNNKKIPTIITLFPLRGYDEETKNISKYLLRLNSDNIRNIHNYLINQLESKPGIYSTKVKVRLKPEYSALCSFKEIFLYLFNIIELNLEGIIKNIDIEFLHDFRTSVRRARTLLSQMKNIINEDFRNELNKEFKTIQKICNNARDLDVFINSQKRFESELPLELRDGLHSLFDYLKEQRKTEQHFLVKALSSNEFLSFIKESKKVLSSNELENTMCGKLGKGNIKGVANDLIYKRYLLVIKKGRKIKNDTKDNALHELRIECKKLRYLIEFFASLYFKKEIKIIEKNLNMLQDYLGEFSDLSVQRRKLQEYLDQILARESNIRELATSVGGLITIKHRKQLKIRKSFQRVFSEFSNKKNQKIFKIVFQN